MSISTDIKILTILVLFIILFFSFNTGFASENENLVVSSFNKYSIEFKDVKVVAFDGVNQAGTRAFISSNHNNVYLNISDMQYPGAYAKFEIVIINNGNKDVDMKEITVNGFENSNAIKYKIIYKTDLIDNTLKSGECLTIEFIIEWDKNINIISDEILNFSIELPFSN